MTPAEIAAFDAATDMQPNSSVYRGDIKGQWHPEGDFMLRHCGGHDLGSKLMSDRNVLLRETPPEIVRFMQAQPLAFRESEYNCRDADMEDFPSCAWVRPNLIRAGPELPEGDGAPEVGRAAALRRVRGRRSRESHRLHLPWTGAVG